MGLRPQLATLDRCVANKLASVAYKRTSFTTAYGGTVSVLSVGGVVAELSLRARSLLSLGMGRNGYVPPTSSMQPGPQHDPDYVAPGSQEHLLGADNPSDLARNAFGHASALMACTYYT